MWEKWSDLAEVEGTFGGSCGRQRKEGKPRPGWDEPGAAEECVRLASGLEKRMDLRRGGRQRKVRAVVTVPA